MLHNFAILFAEGLITAELFAPLLVPALLVLAFICMAPGSDKK